MLMLTIKALTLGVPAASLPVDVGPGVASVALPGQKMQASQPMMCGNLVNEAL